MRIKIVTALILLLLASCMKDIGVNVNDSRYSPPSPSSIVPYLASNLIQAEQDSATGLYYRIDKIGTDTTRGAEVLGANPIAISFLTYTSNGGGYIYTGIGWEYHPPSTTLHWVEMKGCEVFQQGYLSWLTMLGSLIVKYYGSGITFYVPAGLLMSNYQLDIYDLSQTSCLTVSIGY